MIAPDADPQTCSPYAWAHVKMGQRQALRSAYAGLLKERVARTAPPVKIPPPPVTDRANTLPVETGCLMCGISHESVPAVTVAREGRADIARWIWTPPKRVSPTQLGGQGPQQLSGFLCQSCAGAVEHVRSIGPTALERALVSALMPQGLGKLGWGQAVMEGLIGWGALAATRQASPNVRPWAHLGDLAVLSEHLRRRLG